MFGYSTIFNHMAEPRALLNQNMMLWAAPAALLNQDLTGPLQADGLVARVIEAGR